MCDLDHWLATWRTLGVSNSLTLSQLHATLLDHYAEPQRHYHTAQHLTECFANVQPILPLATHPAEVELALWFHDAIYDPQRADNEERSAAWARTAALSFGVQAEVVERLAALILSTRHTAKPASMDAQVLVDADLAILGAPADRFDEYEQQVRQEYHWVSEPIFRRKRSEVLVGFLERQTIYSTAMFVDKYEARARDNLRRSLAGLRANG